MSINLKHAAEQEEEITHSETASQESEEKKYKTTFIDRGSTRNRRLVDVDGRIVMDAEGTPLNVWSSKLADEIAAGNVRIIHQVTKEPTYHYIVTSNFQLQSFQDERVNGSFQPYKKFHVYVDEDVDTTNPSYYINFRKRL